jgi:hypothetical protein
VEEKYMLTEDDEETGLKKGEIAYRVNGQIQRRMTNVIQEVMPKKYEYSGKEGVESAFNNTIGIKGLNEDSINDFIDSINALLAVNKLPGANNEFVKKLKDQLRKLNGLTAEQIKLEKQKDKILDQLDKKDIDIAKAEKDNNEVRINQLVEQKNGLYKQLQDIENQLKAAPATTESAEARNTTKDIIMNMFMEETYQDSRDAGNYVDDAKDYLESGVKPKFDEKKLTPEAYEDLFGLNGYLTKLKQKVDSGEFYLIGRDLVVYDTKNRIAGEIDLLLATKDGIMIVDIKSGEQRKWMNFNKNSKSADKLNYSKREEYTIQQGGYATMLERMIDYPVKAIALLPIQRSSNPETNQMVSAQKPDATAPTVYKKLEFEKNPDGTYKRNEFGELVIKQTDEKASDWFIPLYRESVQDKLDILFPPSTVKFKPGQKDKITKAFNGYKVDLQSITDEDTEENKAALVKVENDINNTAKSNDVEIPEDVKELLKEKKLALGKVVSQNLINATASKYEALATKSKDDVDKLVKRLAKTKSDISFDDIDLSPESDFIQEQLEKDKLFRERYDIHQERFEGKTYKPTDGQLAAVKTLATSGILSAEDYDAIENENYNVSQVSELIHKAVKRIQYLSANSDTTEEAQKFRDYQKDIINLMFNTKVNQSNIAITTALTKAQNQMAAGNVASALATIENEIYTLERNLEKAQGQTKEKIQEKINDLTNVNEAIVNITGYVEEQFIPEQEVTEGELEEFDPEEQLDKIIVKKGMALYKENDKFTVQTVHRNNTVTLKDSSGNPLTVTMEELNKNYKTQADILGPEAAPEEAPLTPEEQDFVNQSQDNVDTLLGSDSETNKLMNEADKIKSSTEAEDDLLDDLNCK